MVDTTPVQTELELGVTRGRDWLARAVFRPPALISIGRNPMAVVSFTDAALPDYHELFRLHMDGGVLLFEPSMHVELRLKEGLQTTETIMTGGLAASTDAGWRLPLVVGSKGAVRYGDLALLFKLRTRREVPLKAVHAFGLDLGDMTAQHAARVVPSRNAALLSLAANVAPGMGGDALVIGCNQADDRDYPDCRRGFLDSMEAALGLPVLSPLIGMSKAQIIAKAKELGLTQADAWSCYTAGPRACGACPSCLEADSAWAME